MNRWLSLVVGCFVWGILYDSGTGMVTATESDSGYVYTAYVQPTRNGIRRFVMDAKNAFVDFQNDSVDFSQEKVSVQIADQMNRVEDEKAAGEN